MHRFLFRFGFCTPAQWEANEAHRWDDESSSAFFVLAENAEAAISWGREVAERYGNYLFEQAGVTKITSWKDSQFAHWIEEKPAPEFTSEYLEKLPQVTMGQVPDFRLWL
jgi:hypothetical protein